MMGHIQHGFDGSSIQRWELDHGIARVVRGECEYVVCTNWNRFLEQCEAEKRAQMREYVAEKQAAEYLGGGA